MKRPKYSIEIPWDGDASHTSEYGQWRNYDGIQAEGDTLDELLADATVFLQDQDGGSCGYLPADDEEMQAAVEREYHAQCMREMNLPEEEV